MKKIIFIGIYLGGIWLISDANNSILPLFYGLILLGLWFFIRSIIKEKKRRKTIKQNIKRIEEKFPNKNVFLLNKKYILSFNDDNNKFEILSLPNDIEKLEDLTFDILTLKEVDFIRNKEVVSSQLNSEARVRNEEIERFYLTLVFENNSKLKIELEDIASGWTNLGKRAKQFEAFYITNMAKVEK